MGKSTSFLSVHNRVFPLFRQINRPEPARKVIQDDEVTHTNLYEGPGKKICVEVVAFQRDMDRSGDKKRGFSITFARNLTRLFEGIK